MVDDIVVVVVVVVAGGRRVVVAAPLICRTTNTRQYNVNVTLSASCGSTTDYAPVG